MKAFNIFNQIIALLRKYGLRPAYKFAQNYLIDPTVIERQIQYTQLSKSDIVLEIGAGLGTLTKALAKAASKVFAIEADKKLIPVLKDQLSGFSNVEIIEGDALKIDFPKANKIVSNLPYVISSPITFKILDTEFELAVLTYQKEFAERMVAKPGTSEYGRLSVGVYYRASVELLETIPPSAFYPKPKVYSTIVRLRQKTPPFRAIDEKFFFNVVRALFQHRRKKVNNALFDSFHEIAPELKWPKEKIKTFLGKTVKLDTRVFLLKPEEIGSLSNVLYENLKAISA